jgi:heme/copper-type cytochrome/quinol oxidase subunit 1
MMEKKCKHCAMMIPRAAKICPHCSKAQGWTATAKIGAFLVSLVVVIAFISSMASWNQTAPALPTEDDLPQRAFYKAQGYVKANLKAPSTAVFPHYDLASVKRVAGDERGAMYEVVSYVDSQNSFGAQLRTSYKCSVVRVHANSSWVLAELKTW